MTPTSSNKVKFASANENTNNNFTSIMNNLCKTSGNLGRWLQPWTTLHLPWIGPHISCFAKNVLDSEEAKTVVHIYQEVIKNVVDVIPYTTDVGEKRGRRQVFL